METRQPLVRIGRIDYTNVWPIFFYFPLQAFGSQIEMVPQVPTTLNRGMAAGEIAMGPISSFSYGEHYRDYVLYPGLSVSAFRHVHSLLLFHRKPIEQLDGASIALTTSSATTVNLLKIILQKFYGLSPKYEYAAPSLTDMMENRDASLLIGDDAIRSSWIDHGYYVTDLGAEWEKHTGCWMSFAVWAVRKQTLEEQPELVKRIHEAFLESKRKSLADPTALIEAAQSKIGGTTKYWHDYFMNLCYDFGPDQWKGLSLYYKYCAELGLLQGPVSLQIWNEKTGIQVTE